MFRVLFLRRVHDKSVLAHIVVICLRVCLRTEMYRSAVERQHETGCDNTLCTFVTTICYFKSNRMGKRDNGIITAYVTKKYRHSEQLGVH